MQQHERVRVKVANGAIVNSEEKVIQVPFSIQEWEFKFKAYVISLSGCDMFWEFYGSKPWA